MPIDFRTYTDPGVYIEAITPPVVFTAAIEPTILAIVGEAPSARTVFESQTLSALSSTALLAQGADPETLTVTDRINGTPYISAAVGELATAETLSDTSWSVNTYTNSLIPSDASNRVQIFSAADFASTDSFTLTYGGSISAAITFGTAAATVIKAALEALTEVDTVTVVGNADSGKFAVILQDVNAGYTAITSTPTGFGGWTIGNGFLAQVEDEIVGVATGVAGLGATWTVVRGIDSTAVSHIAGQVVNLYDAYSTDDALEVGSFVAPVSATATSFTVNEGYGVQTVTLTTFDGVKSFTLTYGGQTTATITRGTNYTVEDVTTALEALSTVDELRVVGLNDSEVTLPDTGFKVFFRNPNTDNLLLTHTPTGHTAVVASRGVANNTFLDVEGERMRVTAVSGTAPQTVTVVRGVGGTTAKAHGAVNIYENSGADYMVRVGAGSDATVPSADDTIALEILDAVRLVEGTVVNISLSVTDTAQFAPSLFDDMDTVRDKYGDPLTSSGTINSKLSLAAQLAFANGATQLVLVATDSGDTNPVQDAIAKLELEQGINTLAVLSYAVADHNYTKWHVDTMSLQGQLRRAFVGLDGTTAPAPVYTDFISKAQTLNDERVILVAPGQFLVDNGTSTPLMVPGYFGAAAVAGLHAGLPPQEPLTRKQVFGFVGINDQTTNANTFSMQSKGVLVVFEDRIGRLIVKHGLTTNMTTTYTREISVGAARDRLRDFIYETLDGGALLGSAMTNETPNLVMAAVNNALEEATRQGLIADYNDVKFRIPADQPTLIEVRFSYKPTLPLNYIHVQFSIDTSANTVEFQTINDEGV